MEIPISTKEQDGGLKIQKKIAHGEYVNIWTKFWCINWMKVYWMFCSY